MAARVPVPLLCALLAAVEATLVTSLFSQYLRHGDSWTWAFSRLTAANLSLWLLWAWQVYPRFQSPLRHLPQPKGGYPILAHGLAQFARPPGALFGEWMQTIPNDGLILYHSIFNRDRLLITHPKILSEILVTRTYDFAKPERLRDLLRRVLGDGLIVVEGDQHRFQRKHIMPVFSFRHIKNLYPMMWGKSIELTKCVAAEIHANPDTTGADEKGLSGVIEITQWANKATMDVIGVAGLGREFNALKNMSDELMDTYDEILEPTVEKAVWFAANLIFPTSLVAALPWKLNERVKITSADLRRICLNLVLDKKLALQKGEEHVDILSTLIKSDMFSDQELIDQLLTFLAAGHDTTSSAFTWICYLLATHPEIQSEARAEIRTAIPSAMFGDPTALSTLSELLENLPYLNAVCNESLRLYPTVPVLLRIAVRDTQLGSVFVPKDTQCLLVPCAINQDPNLWGPDAHTFSPQRWIDEKDGELRPNNTGGATNNYAYLTFLHGPRSCIGQGFAKAELRCLVAAWLGAFEMSMADPSEEVRPGGQVTMKPLGGMKLRIKAVGGW